MDELEKFRSQIGQDGKSLQQAHQAVKSDPRGFESQPHTTASTTGNFSTRNSKHSENNGNYSIHPRTQSSTNVSDASRSKPHNKADIEQTRYKQEEQKVGETQAEKEKQRSLNLPIGQPERKNIDSISSLAFDDDSIRLPSYRSEVQLPKCNTQGDQKRYAYSENDSINDRSISKTNDEFKLSLFDIQSEASIMDPSSPTESNSHSYVQKKKFSWDQGFGKQLESNVFEKKTTKLHHKQASDFNNLIVLQEICGEVFKGETLRNPKSSNPCWVAKFSPDDNFLAIGGADCALRVFLINYELPYTPLEFSRANINLLIPKHRSYLKHVFDIIDLDWSADSKRILTASVDNKAILWSLDKDQPLQIFDHGDIVSCVCFHPSVYHHICLEYHLL